MKKNIKINKEKDIEAVVEHYLDYPYPARNPEDEKTRLLQIHGENLDELNHWLFKGKQNFNDNFRVLVAGGGTGDASTYMAEQLRNKKAEVIYLDFSKNSMEIAKKRAEIRGLKNITFINDSIFNIPDLKLGKFDYINCSGVLHHLSSPSEGLKILQESLKPEGGMGLMVYAKYGRTAVYQIQELMRMVNLGVTSRADEVKNAKSILESLPNTNWYSRSQDLISDVRNYGDIGIYDLFLHKQDRCYSIPELYDFVENAGLNFVQFSETLPRLSLKIENFIRDTQLLAKIKEMPLRTQQAMAEIITGNVIKHTFFASNIKDSVASIDDHNNIPVFFGIKDVASQIVNHLRNNPNNIGTIMSLTIKSVWVPNGMSISIPVSDLTLSFFENISDESKPKSLAEIFADIKTKIVGATDADLKLEAKKIINLFTDAGVMVLKDKALIRQS